MLCQRAKNKHCWSTSSRKDGNGLPEIMERKNKVRMREPDKQVLQIILVEKMGINNALFRIINTKRKSVERVLY